MGSVRLREEVQEHSPRATAGGAHAHAAGAMKCLGGLLFPILVPACTGVPKAPFRKGVMRLAGAGCVVQQSAQSSFGGGGSCWCLCWGGGPVAKRFFCRAELLPSRDCGVITGGWSARSGALGCFS